MVTEYGMSSLGPVQLEHRSESVFLGRDYNQTKNFSDQVAHEIDQEVRKIIDECYEKAKEILRTHKKLVDVLAETLMTKETLTKEEIEDIVEANSDIKIKREEKLSDQIKEDIEEEKQEKTEEKEENKSKKIKTSKKETEEE